MESYPQYGHINDICLIGHGTIGRGTVPLIKRHFSFDKMTIVDPDPKHLPDPDPKVEFRKLALTRVNYIAQLDKIFTGKLRFCVNLSMGISSASIIAYCQERGILYVDSSNQEWEGFYTDEDNDLEKMCNYTFRINLLNQIRQLNSPTTAIMCCGANPGMVNWLVKQALLNLAKDTGFKIEEEPKTQEKWAWLMMKLGVKGFHIAERDTQITKERRPYDEFWNTWSIDGFISQGYYQPAELGWGTHQKEMPPNGRSHTKGPKSAIYLTSPGLNVHMKSWTPCVGPQSGFLISHEEALSMVDYYTVKEGQNLVYRPTVYFVYHPCQDAYVSCLQCIGTGQVLEKWSVKIDELVSGVDELGVLLFGHQKGAYWYGSTLDLHDARARAPYQNATSLAVCSAVIAGMAWGLQNPKEGLVGTDEMDFKKSLQIVQPYIAPLKGVYPDWNPLKNKGHIMVEDQFDLDDPWQFKNFVINK